MPPLPAASRPSKTMMMRAPLFFAQFCSLTSSTCSLNSSASYCLFFIFGFSAGCFALLTVRVDGRVGILVFFFLLDSLLMRTFPCGQNKISAGTNENEQPRELVS